jgi:hypothetical protein
MLFIRTTLALVLSLSFLVLALPGGGSLQDRGEPGIEETQ